MNLKVIIARCWLVTIGIIAIVTLTFYIFKNTGWVGLLCLFGILNSTPIYSYRKIWIKQDKN